MNVQVQMLQESKCSTCTQATHSSHVLSVESDEPASRVSVAPSLISLMTSSSSVVWKTLMLAER